MTIKFTGLRKGRKILLLCQNDKIMIQSDEENITKDIFKNIGLRLQLEKEYKLTAHVCHISSLVTVLTKNLNNKHVHAYSAK